MDGATALERLECPSEGPPDEVLASRAHRVVANAAGRCPECVEFALAFNRARCEAGKLRSLHAKALEREKAGVERIAHLEAKLKLRERQLFAKKTERKKRKQRRLEAVAKASGDKAAARSRGQPSGAVGHGRRQHSRLPAVVEIHDLPDGQKCCPQCHQPFVAFEGTEDSEVVEVEVRAHRRVIRRKRYRSGCRCPQQPGIITAPAPPKVIPKGSLGISVWATVLLDKFLFQRPTYRLLQDFRYSHGLDLSQGTVTGGLQRLAPLFEPLYAGLIEHQLSEHQWMADETRWAVFEEVPGKQNHRWYLWAFASASTVVFKLDPSRGAHVPVEHFGDVTGTLNVDRYVAYKVLAKEGRIVLAFCWSHQRRDFWAVGRDWGKRHEAWAEAWLGRIGELYYLQHERLAVREDAAAWAAADDRLREAVERIRIERDRQLVEPSLHPAYAKALKSLKRHWPGLVLFVDHPDVPMDNNRIERLQRGPVVGRKNYYGSGCAWSGHLAAHLFSIFQTLLVWDLNPRSWLLDYLQACAEAGGRAPKEAARWLPWNLSESARTRLTVPPRAS